MSGVRFVALLPADATKYWALLCEGLDPIEAVFGPEGRDPRPRAQDTYWLARLEAGALIGMIWTQRPSQTTVAFGMGLFASCRGRGLGPRMRDAAYDFVFQMPGVHKLESQVYSSNDRSLLALHGPFRRSREEGRQRETIQVNGVFYDRCFFGITRREWQEVRLQ